MATTFPKELDEFPQLGTSAGETLPARVANNYAASLVATQTYLSGLVSRSSRAQQKMMGMVYRFEFIAAPDEYYAETGRQSYPAPSVDGNPPFYDRASPSWDRETMPFELAENKTSFSPFRYTPLSPVDNLVTLPIPNIPAAIPNGTPFHEDNVHLVTVECQIFPSINDIGEDVVEWDTNENKRTGGPFIREGILYHDGDSDFNPKYCLQDWMMYLVGDRGAGHDKTRYNFYVHYVIVG